MRILQRYIVKNVMTATAMILVVVMALSFVTGMLQELHSLGEGDYGFIEAVLHELLSLPHSVYQFFPMLVLLGGVVGLGMLSSGHELVVMRTAGVSVWQIVRSVMVAALILIVMATVMGEILAPRANFVAEKQKSFAQTHGQAVVTVSGMWVHEGNDFIHIDKVIGHHHLQGVTRYEFDEQHRLLATSFAKSLSFDHGTWKAYHVSRTMIGNGKTNVESFPVMTWSLSFTPTLLNVGLIEAEAMSLQKLKEYSNYLTQNRLQASSFQLAFWQRIFQPLTTLVMILLAVPFVFGAPRSTTLGKRTMFAVLLGFAFYMLNAFFGELSIVYRFPPVIAAILPTLLFSALGVVWMYRLGQR